MAPGNRFVEWHLPERGLRAIPDPARVRALSDGVEAGLVLPVVMPSRDGEAGLCPDDLGARLKPCGLDPGLNRDHEQGSVPAVEDLGGDQLPDRSPVGAVVVTDATHAAGGV